MISDPILSDVYKNTYHDGHYIEDYIDKDSILYDVTKRKSTYRYSNYYVDGYGHGDTVFDGAFCVDNFRIFAPEKLKESLKIIRDRLIASLLVKKTPQDWHFNNQERDNGNISVFGFGH